MADVITRFAPSPTGMLHIGNVRTALINYLYTKKHNGQFILRIDDTDTERSKKAFEEAIKDDLTNLGIEWDNSFNQSSKITKYEAIKEELIKSKRLYACYETPEELDIKRKLQLSNGKPPIYDRSSLKLSQEQIEAYEKAGRKPHYRFLIADEEISWHDEIKGEIKYHGSKLSDPVIIRADGSMTYMLCSTVDDIDSGVTHVIRGEDHVSNTAIQIQMFKALGSDHPTFAHLGLIKTKESKISKREGGHDIRSMLQNGDILPMALNSFLGLIGTSKKMQAFKNMHDLINEFDINSYSTSPTNYLMDELEQLNHKLLIQLDYDDIKAELSKYGADGIDEEFWLAVRPNISKIAEVKTWWNICKTHNKTEMNVNKQVITAAIQSLPEEVTDQTWQPWTKEISNITGIKGREMFMSLRLALTGLDSGPELKALLPLLNRDKIIERLKYYQ